MYDSLIYTFNFILKHESFQPGHSPAVAGPAGPAGLRWGVDISTSWFSVLAQHPCSHCIFSPPRAYSLPQHEAWPPGLFVTHIHSHPSTSSKLYHASFHLQSHGRDPQIPTNGHHSFRTPWQNSYGTLVAALDVILRDCCKLAGDRKELKKWKGILRNPAVN